MNIQVLVWKQNGFLGFPRNTWRKKACQWSICYVQDVQVCQYSYGLCYSDVTMACWLVQIWFTSTHRPQTPPRQIQNKIQQDSLKSQIFPEENGIFYILKHFSFFYWIPLSRIQRSRVVSPLSSDTFNSELRCDLAKLCMSLKAICHAYIQVCKYNRWD